MSNKQAAITLAVGIFAAATAGIASVQANVQTGQSSDTGMSFFLTSRGPGQGGNLGGLEGADRHCQALATEAGAGDRTWRAYLSTQAPALNDPNFIDARDRIGSGPWYNADGVMIAKDVDDLHSRNNNLTRLTAIDERGQTVKGRGDSPNEHDILTGSRLDGTTYPGAFGDRTCGNWTSDAPDASAMLGHHDRSGPVESSWGSSWNSAHPSRGCHPEGLKSTGGAGLFYCFAVD